MIERWLIKSSPSKRLSTTLKKLNKQQILYRLMILGIPYDENEKKEPLLTLLSEHLQTEAQLLDLITWTTTSELEQLKKLCHASPMALEDALEGHFEYPLETGLVHLFESNQAPVLSLQAEVSDLIKGMTTDALSKVHKLKNEMTTFLRASANLYGIVPLDVVYQIYNAYFPEQLNYDSFLDLAYASQVRNENYFIEQDVLYANFFIEQDAFKGMINDILSAPFDYYHPEYDQFASFATMPLNGMSKSKDNLIKLILSVSKLPRENVAQDLDYLLQFIPLDGFIKYLNELGIVFKSNSQLKQATELYLSAKNKTRSWLCRGFAFEELSKLKPETVRVQKIGRNEKCPCNSGKKYKHCCGAN